MHQHHLSFSDFYDRYSPVMFNMAVSITGSTLVAEEILIITFLKIRVHQHRYPRDPDIFFQLMSLLVLTTREVLIKKNCRGNFRMQRFQHMPILSKILFEQMDIEGLCKEMKIERGAIGKLVREEVKGILSNKS